MTKKRVHHACPNAARDLLERAKTLRYTDTRTAYTDLEVALHQAEAQGDTHALLDALKELAICSHVLNNYAQTIAWAELLLEKARYYRSNQYESSAHNLLGIGHHDIGNLDIALEHFQAALSLQEKIGQKRSIASFLHNIGNIYVIKGQFEVSLEWYLRALALREHISRELMPRLLNGLGYAYYHLGKHDDAVRYLTQSLEIAEADGFSFMQIVSLESLADVYIDYGDYTTALNFCIKALVLAEQLDNKKEIASKKLRLGTIYLRMGDYLAAIAAFSEALSIGEQLGAVLIKITALAKLGEVQRALGERERAQDSFTQARALAQKYGYEFLDAQASLELAKLFIAQGEHSAAQALLQDGLSASERACSKVMQQQYHDTLAVLYKSLGDITRSARHTKLSQQLYAEVSARGTAHHLLVEFETQRLLKHPALCNQSDHHAAIVFARKAIEQKYSSLSLRYSTHTTASAASDRKALAVFVKTFGEFVVTIGGYTLTKSDWKRKKARDIFKILLIHHQKAVTTDELIELLWNGNVERHVEQVIKNSISFIRKAIEPNLGAREPSAFLRNEGKAYILDLGENAFIDFLEFKSLIAQAAKLSDRIALYKKAVALYTGDFLKEDLYADWAIFERESLKDTYLSTLSYLAEHALKQSEKEEAVLYGRQIIETDCTHDKGYDILLRVYLQHGNHAEARRVYAQCKDAFEKELGTLPPKHLQTLMSGLE
ncbi:MAG: tetratricopeptide repeat protein [Candidatus Thermochlorobacter sp.]